MGERQPSIFDRRDLLKQLPRPVRVGCVILGGAFGLAGAACGPTPVPKPSPEVQKPGSSPVLAATSEITLGYPFSGLWYLNAGPHSDKLTKGVRTALDFAAPEVIDCPGRKPLEDRFVEASAAGKVAIVGNERNTTDPNHSIVEIDHAQGLRTGYMHLANISVNVGQEVKQGQRLGNPSCEIPPGGDTSGIHLHWYVKKGGEFLPADGIKFPQGQIKAGPNNKEGTLIGPNNFVRTANKKRCGPDEISIKSDACDGKRNDLNTGTVLGESVKVAPLPTTVTAAKPEPTRPAQKSKELPFSTELDNFSSLRFPYQFRAPRGWLNGPLHEGPSRDTYLAFPPQTSSTFMMITFATARMDVQLEALKNQIIGPGGPRTEALSNNRGTMIIEFHEKYINGLDAWVKLTDEPKTDELKRVTREIVFVRPGETWHIKFVSQGDRTKSFDDEITHKTLIVVQNFTLSGSK